MPSSTGLAIERRHSAMYENFLIRQISGFSDPEPLTGFSEGAEDEPAIVPHQVPSEEEESEISGWPEDEADSDSSCIDGRSKFLHLDSNPSTRQRAKAVNSKKRKAKLQMHSDASGDNISLEFKKFKKLQSSRYIFFSEKFGILQAERREALPVAKHYWLNISDPSKEDFEMLLNEYGVHALTIRDIYQRNTTETIEVFKDYIFLSLRLMGETLARDVNANKVRSDDLNLNVILFKDFIVTVHDAEWSNMGDILGFLDLLCKSSPEGVRIPEWVLFSCFIELRQDAKYMMDLTRPYINQIRTECETTEPAVPITDMMRRKYEMERQTYTISRYIKPKMKILRELRKTKKYSNRLNAGLTEILYTEIYSEFEELEHELEHFEHVLERSQDTLLSVLSTEQARERNELSGMMERLSEVFLLFLPKVLVGLFFGMNCMVPFERDPSIVYFSVLVGAAGLSGLALYTFRNKILSVIK